MSRSVSLIWSGSKPEQLCLVGNPRRRLSRLPLTGHGRAKLVSIRASFLRGKSYSNVLRFSQSNDVVMGFFWTFSVAKTLSNCGAYSPKGILLGDQQPGARKQTITMAGRDNRVGSLDWMSKADPYEVLGLTENSSEEDIKAAFRAMVKEYHPDVYKGEGDADAITQRLVRAYQLLTSEVEQVLYKRKNTDPFEDPECVAEDLFVNELNCIGKGCPYSCVARAPDVFQFASETGCARAMTQGKGGDYHVQLAVGQCPRNCIHYVTPDQRSLLEEMLQSALDGTIYSGDTVVMDGLIARARFENGRFRLPKRKPRRTDQWVDCLYHQVKN